MDYFSKFYIFMDSDLKEKLDTDLYIYKTQNGITKGSVL